MLHKIILAAAAVCAAYGQSNAELARLFQDDQADRSQQFTMTDTEKAQVFRRDAPRLKRVRELAASGALRTSEDFVRAAFLFQHGTEANDFLLAHVLGMIATKMDGSGAWISAASLDRYLLMTGRPQVFGLTLSDAVPFDRTVLTDAMRVAFCAPGLADRARLMDSIAKDPAHPLLLDPCIADPKELLKTLSGKWMLTWKDAKGEFQQIRLTLTDADMAISGGPYPPHTDMGMQFGGNTLKLQVKGDTFDLALHGDTVSGQYTSGGFSAAVAGVR
jgi:hypothetical protein